MAKRGRPPGSRNADRSGGRGAALGKALVLNRWLLAQFNVESLEALAGHMKGSAMETWDENNETRYYHDLRNRAYTFPGITADKLLEYDRNIVSHTLSISAKRPGTVRWKYFQYLALLFTEYYLDRYYGDPAGLLADLNRFVEGYNDPHNDNVRNESGVEMPLFEAQELNKIAFWMATGSGKTLLMHVNILQHAHWLERHGRPAINRIILVTPNEGLSEQHLREFDMGGLEARRFDRQAGTAFSGTYVDVIEITKLKDEHKENEVAVEAFEQNNLVLIDEGHRGLGSDEKKQKNYRDTLSRAGFAFEYSATFGQAVGAAQDAGRQQLMEEYGKSILFDYSYRYFHKDGYGKDYLILNLPDRHEDTQVRKYMTGNLLTYYQQRLIWEEHHDDMRRFNLAKPLFVFVGGSVSRTSKSEHTDVLRIISFFERFISDAAESQRILAELIDGRDGLLDQNNQSIFRNRFNYLRNRAADVGALYADLLDRFFNTALVGAKVHVDRLKGATGELGLRVGNAPYFGVVNVGDEKSLYDLLKEKGIEVSEKEFAKSLFQEINAADSPINLLVGARKFTEGWSSWRVSCMGLMNIARTEGSQVIQMFGRGVRLKGYGSPHSLKRSRELDQDQRPEGRVPAYIPTVETLNVFGIRADYMEAFKQFLRNEDLPANDSQLIEVDIPVMPMVDLEKARLKVIQVKDGKDFKKDRTVTLSYEEPDGRAPIVLDWYPRIQMLQGQGSATVVMDAAPPQRLRSTQLAFIDWDTVYFELQRFKNERAWYNLSIPYEAMQDIMGRPTWYDLLIPEQELVPRKFREDTLRWQEITVNLLKKYVERQYQHAKSAYESQFMECVPLTKDHPNFQEVYHVEVQRAQEDIIRNLSKLTTALKDDDFSQDIEFARFFRAVYAGFHLYQPLLFLDERYSADLVTISPVALNEGEARFIEHLRHFHEHTPAFFEGKRLFLLRNRSRKGIGFFEANGFYPDFLLWLIDDTDNIQRIGFIDPKGLRQVNGFDHPKLKFHRILKEEIEPRLADPSIQLHAFIVSTTPFEEIRHWRGGRTIAEFNRQNVWFQKDQQTRYMAGMLSHLLAT